VVVLSSSHGFHSTTFIRKDELDLEFNDHKAAYRIKRNSEIVRGFTVLTLCGIKPLVANNAKLMDLGQKILGKALFSMLMKQSFYGHFVAGENQGGIKPVISRMHSFGVKSILDYSVEADEAQHNEGEARFDANLKEFLQCIDVVKESTEGLGFAAIKITALGSPEILIHLSKCVERTIKYYTEVLKKKEIHTLDWSSLVKQKNDGPGGIFLVPILKTGKMEKLITEDDEGALTALEEEQFMNMVSRLHTLFKYAKEQDVRVQVDAEQSYFQPAIHRLTMEMMREYNTERAIVFNTQQCYLRKSLETVMSDLDQARRQNFYYGAKLVRGAYMEQERERAALHGYEDPINLDFEATSAMYHSVLDECLRRIKALKEAGEDPDKIKIMVASHNADTVRYGIRRMEELGLHPQDRVLSFAQLFGMCDQITFPLGQAGYSVYKYVPYGPVNEVLPYLSRRANENGTMLERVAKEKGLLFKELFRRMSKGDFFYKPKGHYKPVGFN